MCLYTSTVLAFRQAVPYTEGMRLPEKMKRIFTKRRLKIAGISLAGVIVAFHAWLHFTNPYAHFSIVQQPYKTAVENGEVTVQKQFDLQALDGSIARGLGYYKSGFLIVQNAYFGSYKAPSTTADGIIRDIHQLRFDPSKPYLISGDQFSVLYPRNLGVFYNSLLDPRTAHSQVDWENKQRIYLQSALYALDAFSAAGDLTTTIVPVAPRAVALTQVHPGSVPSDTLYGMFYALAALQDSSHYGSDTPYKLQTVAATKRIVTERQADLRKLLDIYLTQVRDPQTGLVHAGLDLASARDGVVRDRAFYDNVVLWKTLSLARDLGISDIAEQDLIAMRTKLIQLYWDDHEGHFRDDLSAKPAHTNYSSDWLLALPTGFLNPNDPADQPYLTRSVAFIRQQGIDKPFPIKYKASGQAVEAPWAVKTFVPNYGGDAIWSYWGAQYITLLAQLSPLDTSYLADARHYRDIYRQKIEQYRGFPETFDAEGNFLQNFVYKSIRQTGWVVQFEQAEWAIKTR